MLLLKVQIEMLQMTQKHYKQQCDYNYSFKNYSKSTAYYF